MDSFLSGIVYTNVSPAVMDGCVELELILKYDNRETQFVADCV